MAANTQHPQYQIAAPIWRRCRDAVAGQDAVHAAGPLYLPKLSEQTSAEYAAYVARSLFFNATGRTLDGMTGMVFRKPAQVELPPGIEYMLTDVDTAGTPLSTQCDSLVDDLLIVGRGGLLADFPPVEPGATLAEERAIGARPYIKQYRPEQIINWRESRIGSKNMLTLVVLHEEVTGTTDGFDSTSEQQWRVLRLLDGVYVVEIWRRLDDTSDPVMIESRIPTMQGAPMSFIPFVIVGPPGIGSNVCKPPLIDLVHVNLSHYRSTADYEHGLHFTGLPTPYVTGHRFEDGDKFALGSTVVKAFPSSDAKAQFLEFTGSGLVALSTRLAEKEQMMIALGARMLASPVKGVESAETAGIHRAGENSVLASLANAASSAISTAITWCAQWQGIDEPATVHLNTDYLPSGMTAQDLQALVGAWQAGAVSFETMHENLMRGEVVTRSAEDERELIDAAGPPLGAQQSGEQL